MGEPPFSRPSIYKSLSKSQLRRWHSRSARRRVSTLTGAGSMEWPSEIDCRVLHALVLIAQKPSVRVVELAAGVSLSPSRLEHLFKGVTGSSIMTAKVTYRLHRAAHALISSTEPIKTVRFDCGFKDASNLLVDSNATLESHHPVIDGATQHIRHSNKYQRNVLVRNVYFK